MTDFNEMIDGDLSDDRNNPTDITLTLGDNIITATQQGGASLDRDYFTITVPVGTELTGIVLDGYTVATSTNRGFIGIQAGDEFTEPPTGTDAANILGGLVYGTANLGDNILADAGAAPGFIGFSGPLPAGTYTIWLNQTGPASTAELNFSVEISTPTITVSNTNTSGMGSFSDAVTSANIAPGVDIIGFDAGLSGQTINTSGVLTVTDDLFIDGDIDDDGVGDITIAGVGTSPLIELASAGSDFINDGATLEYLATSQFSASPALLVTADDISIRPCGF